MSFLPQVLAAPQLLEHQSLHMDPIITNASYILVLLELS